MRPVTCLNGLLDTSVEPPATVRILFRRLRTRTLAHLFSKTLMIAESPTIAVKSGSLPSSRTSSLFIASVAGTVVLFWAPLRSLFEFASTSEFSYIPLIPLISAFLIVFRRARIFAHSKPSPKLGGLFIGAGVVVFVLSRRLPEFTASAQMSIAALCVVITWIGLFVFYYGFQTARTAMLPLFLLLFIVPLPDRLLGTAITYLQHGSAVLSYYLFRGLGVAALRDGTAISLPGLEIDVAPQCSGIRSSMSLLILVLAGANLYLRSSWNKLLLVVAVVPLVIVKNAIRIVTLSALALYVDPRFLSGNLHRSGGIFFFLIAVVILVPLVLLMQRLERRSYVRRTCTVAAHLADIAATE
jgi:exosortase